MPIYEYQCSQCGSDFELLVRSGTIILCPTCNNPDPKKRPAASNFALKGEGWARDNYGTKPQKSGGGEGT